MTVLVAAAGLINLEAPLPRPRSDDLLAVAAVEEHDDDGHWLGGAWSEGLPPGPAFSHDPCSTGTDRVKEIGGEIKSQQSGRFTIYQPAVCTAQSVGSRDDRFISRLRRVFTVYERAAVERVLATGDGRDGLGPYLADDNMELLASSAVNPVTALRLLENAIAKHGSGIIHAAPSTVVAWDALNMTVQRGELTYTKRGTPVAVGTGYIDVVLPGPDRNVVGAGQWAFASGPIEIHRGREIDVPGASYAERFDRSMNDIYVIAERPYVFNWLGRRSPDDDSHIQAGVLVDESSTYSLLVVDGCGP